QAKQRLRRQGCTNIELKIANGYHGWSEHAPFDKVIVTAAPDLIPPPLLHQLKAGGKMVIPAGLPDAQRLVLVKKSGDGRVTTRGDSAGAVLAARGDRAGHHVQLTGQNSAMVLEFTVGINITSKHESVTVAAEDALTAALKVKCERPEALINGK